MASPIYSGITPSGAVAAELTNITRRGFVPALVDQFRSYSPLTSSLIDNAQMISGGFNQITVPLQGLPMTTAATIGYDGSFAQPAETQGIFDAQFNLAGLCVPVGFYGAEAAIQMDHTVVNRLDAKLNDASNSLSTFFSTALYNNSTDTSNIIGLPLAIDDGTNGDVYGGLSRTANPWFKAYRRSAGSSVAPTRSLVMQYLIGQAKNAGNEMPDMVICGPGTWMSLASDILSVERYNVQQGQSYANAQSGAEAGFRAVQVAGVPVYFDLYCPEGQFYLINTKYLYLNIHQMAAFDISNFESMLGNFVLGYISLVIAYTQLVNVKPSATGIITGFSSVTL